MEKTNAPKNSVAGRTRRGHDAEVRKDRIVSPECRAMEDLKVVVFRLAEHEHAVDARQVKEILINAPHMYWRRRTLWRV
jgi:hypothetical protein